MDELMNKIEKLLGEVRESVAKVRQDKLKRDVVHCRKLLQGIRRSAFALRIELQKEKVTTRPKVSTGEVQEVKKAKKIKVEVEQPLEAAPQI